MDPADSEGVIGPGKAHRLVMGGMAHEHAPLTEPVAPGKGPLGGPVGNGATWVAQEIRVGLGAAARLRNELLPGMRSLVGGGATGPSLVPLETTAALRRIEQALDRTDVERKDSPFLPTLDELPRALTESRQRLADEYAQLAPEVVTLQDQLPVLDDRDDAPDAAPDAPPVTMFTRRFAGGTAAPANQTPANQTPTTTGTPKQPPGPPAPSSHGFEAADQEPAGVELLAIQAPLVQLPILVRNAIGGVSIAASNETVRLKLLLLPQHRVAIYVERTSSTDVGRKAVVAVIDLVEVATKLAVGGLAATGALASFLTGSKDPVLKTLGGNRVRLLLSAPRQPNNVPDFVVFDIYALLRAVADADWSTFRPLEAQLTAGPIAAARYEGKEHTDEKAFAGRGLRVGVDQDQTVTVPGLRRLVFGEQGPAADAPLYVTGATDGRTVTLGFARDAADNDGAAITLDLVALATRVAKAIQRIAPGAAAAVEKLIDAFQAGFDAGAKILDFLGGLFTLRVPKGGGFISWSLEKLLAAMVKAGRFTLDVFEALIPDGLYLPDLFLFDPSPIGKAIWDNLQVIGGKAIAIGADVLQAMLGAAGGIGGALLEAVGAAGATIAEFGAELGVVVLDGAKLVVGAFIDLFHKNQRKRRIGLTLPLEKLAKLVGKLAGVIGKLAGKAAGRGAAWFAQHLSLGKDGVLRLLLDDPPRAGGNRVGIDLIPFVTSGGDTDKLRLTETFLDGTLADIAYGPETAAVDPDAPAPADATAKPPVPGAVKVSRPPGGTIAETLLPLPTWLTVPYGLPADVAMKTELVVGSSAKGGAVGGFEAHIWSQPVDGKARGDHAFDIKLTVPVPAMIAKRMPNIRAEMLRIDNKASQAEKRLVMVLGSVAPGADGKARGIKGRLSWSLDQVFRASSFEDALTPEQMTIDDGTWALTAGERVDLAPWGEPRASMVPPPSIRSWFPMASVDVFVKSDKDRLGVLFTEHSDRKDRTHAVGMAVEVTKQRFEQLRAKLPKIPGAIDKHLPIAIEADPDGLKLWLGDKADKSASWIKYSWPSVIDFMAGAASLEDLVPDQAHLDATKAGLALDYQTLTKADVPAGTMRVKVKDLPDLVGELVKSFQVTDEHWLHLDAAKSTLTSDGSRVAAVGAVYRELAPGKLSGWKVGLEVDAVKLLSRFLPKSVAAKLQKQPDGKKGLGAGFAIVPGKKGADAKPVPGSAGQDSLQVWIQYVHQKRNKTKEFKVQASWTMQDLLDILLHLDRIDEEPEHAMPSALHGKVGNGSFELDFGSSTDQPKGHRLESFELTLISVLGRMMDEQIAAKAQFWLDEDITGDALVGRMADALRKKEPLVLAKAYLVLPGSGGPGDTYSLALTVQPGAIANLATMIPGGFVVKLGKFLVELVQDPEGKTDDLFYTVAAAPLLVKHADIFKKIDWDKMSVKDVAMAVLLNDEDMRGAYRSLKAFDKLVEAGHIDKDKLPTITPDMARKAMARDPDAHKAYVDLIYSMPMDELKRQAKTRQQAGSQEQYEKIVAFASSLSREHQVLMRKLAAMYEKHGISMDPKGAKEWTPAKAIQKLSTLDETLKRLEAGEAGNRIARQLGGERGEGTGDAAAEHARDHYDGKRGPALDMTQLTRDQLLSILRSGYVVIDQPDGKKVVHHATKAERAQAAQQLMTAANVVQVTPDGPAQRSPDEVLAEYEQLEASGMLGLDDAIAGLAKSGITLTHAQLLAAIEANPRWERQHKHGPAAFGAPTLAVDSLAYAVHIARYQGRLGITPDGIAGPRLVDTLKQQRKLGDARARDEAAQRDAHGGKPGKGGDGKGTGERTGEGKGGDGSGKAEPRPEGARIPLTYQQATSLVSYEIQSAKLQLAANAEQIWTQSEDVNVNTATSARGEVGQIVDVRLRQWHVSRDRPDLEPQIGYQYEFWCKPVTQDEDGNFLSDFRVYSRSYLFLVDLDKAGGGDARRIEPMTALNNALRTAIDLDTGTIRQSKITFADDGGSTSLQIHSASPGRRGYNVVVEFAGAPRGKLVYDVAEERFLPMEGVRTLRVTKPKAEPAE